VQLKTPSKRDHARAQRQQAHELSSRVVRLIRRLDEVIHRPHQTVNLTKLARLLPEIGVVCSEIDDWELRRGKFEKWRKQ
jgi:hypothetical protein